MDVHVSRMGIPDVLPGAKSGEKRTLSVLGRALAAVVVVFLLGLTANPAPAASDAEAIVPESEPVEVRVAIQLDQVTGVDQKAENFTVVGNFIMLWEDPGFAFDPEECACTQKVLNTGQLEKFALENRLIWPRFLFHNQQGKRWIQEDVFRVLPSGEMLYYERFTATLQAPDFDFRRYPFDTQQFKIRIVSLRRDTQYAFVVDPENNSLGTRLGEEEWLIGDYEAGVDTIQFGLRGTHSRFTFSMPARRHVGYYLSRIFLPLGLIVLVAFATFFMKDYAKRVDYSAANLLTFVMFNFAVGSDLPRLGYLTFVDAVLVLAFVITAVTVLANVILKRISFMGKGAVVERVDDLILLGYPMLYLVGVALTVWVYFF